MAIVLSLFIKKIFPEGTTAIIVSDNKCVAACIRGDMMRLDL